MKWRRVKLVGLSIVNLEGMEHLCGNGSGGGAGGSLLADKEKDTRVGGRSESDDEAVGGDEAMFLTGGGAGFRERVL